ncbi:hypothetical protein CLV30_110114 [Haloactinopolyspora alba]|uniref:Uncharacterized protein n=1 Tax=Haloactinopolyspora alba TaxID=648780 RepID=A0A2P8DZ31_9ACTN|nr:hypothetical protein [Haloactinopolyspora alba]PSL02461.1 hypothetical protein CLV30_110114 [Haloactinopolyspora alba]
MIMGTCSGEVPTMPVAEHVRRRCQSLLRPGERIGYLIPTTAAGIGMSTSTVDCYVVVTDRRIAVLVGGILRRGFPREVNIEYPRVTRLGPVEYTPAPTFQLGSRTCRSTRSAGSTGPDEVSRPARSGRNPRCGR